MATPAGRGTARDREDWPDTELVFVWPDGSPLHPNVITRTYGRIVSAAGLPPMRLHNLRHAWATAALLAGVDIKVVSARLGHSSTRITHDIYTAAVPSMDAAAAELVAGLYDRIEGAVSDEGWPADEDGVVWRLTPEVDALYRELRQMRAAIHAVVSRHEAIMVELQQLGESLEDVDGEPDDDTVWTWTSLGHICPLCGADPRTASLSWRRRGSWACTRAETSCSARTSGPTRRCRCVGDGRSRPRSAAWSPARSSIFDCPRTTTRPRSRW